MFLPHTCPWGLPAACFSPCLSVLHGHSMLPGCHCRRLLPSNWPLSSGSLQPPVWHAVRWPMASISPLASAALPCELPLGLGVTAPGRSTVSPWDRLW